MAHVSDSAQVPEVGAHSLGEAESSELLQSLDILLEQYLQLLHRHQTLHAELGKQFSSGFFSLAQANYSSPGRRYGQDYYDERMKATRRISVTPSASAEHDKSPEAEGNENITPSSHSHIFKVETTLVDYETEESPQIETTAQSPDNPKIPESTSDSVSGETVEDRNETSLTPEEPGEGTDAKDSSSPAPSKRGLPSPDPLRWYGVLVPPSLRSAQKSFIAAMETSVPELASITAEMRNVEERVSSLRHRLGLS